MYGAQKSPPKGHHTADKANKDCNINKEHLHSSAVSKRLETNFKLSTEVNKLPPSIRKGHTVLCNLDHAKQVIECSGLRRALPDVYGYMMIHTLPGCSMAHGNPSFAEQHTVPVLVAVPQLLRGSLPDCSNTSGSILSKVLETKNDRP